jgi:hypothetical protein
MPLPATIDLIPGFLPNGEVIHTSPEEAAVLNRAMLQAFLGSMLQKGLRAAFLNPPPQLPMILAGLAQLVEEQKRRTPPPPPGVPAAIARPKTRICARSRILRNTSRRSTFPVALD